VNDNQIKLVKEALSMWNPLGDQAKSVHDLNDYETEAIDILFNIEMEINPSNSKKPKKFIRKIVKETLNEAFRLWLTDEECDEPYDKIIRILQLEAERLKHKV
jgi:hypothetical protein